ncbi:hypothetical protein BJ508DRAFT_371499 [Ascobolus immersus RN42]|uniref:Uncharacterized protein n=1 Tax=Ascobolus immersus RN42 TaxID=1160509 RepID=A0A3N4IRG6_ASCIM|nr:hypothetical protein BJ508DRAFT_371499 [Ascobolus immersus RN42]
MSFIKSGQERVGLLVIFRSTGNAQIMNVLITLFLLFFVPIVAFIVYLALSSCLGDGLRGMRRDPAQRRPDFGSEYLRGMNTGGMDFIEMESMVHDPALRDYDSQ